MYIYNSDGEEEYQTIKTLHSSHNLYEQQLIKSTLENNVKVMYFLTNS